MLRKYKSLHSSTCSTFGTGEGVTITPASVTGLPTDTEITLTFDRVDSSGTKTPSKMERIRGTVTGSNFVISSGGRAVEGTEQVHTSPVVEMIWNADDWNDTVDHILTEHNQDGTHKDTLVTSLKATGAVVNTGTSDVTIVTPKAIADSYLSNGYNSLYRQAIINGSCVVQQRAAPTISTAYQFGAVDRFAVKGAGTAVSAGTINALNTAALTSGGSCIHLSGITLTGTGIVYVRYRMESKDAKQYRNLTASFGFRAEHNVGSAINYTVYVNKADAADDFSAVTAIGNSGAVSVASGSGQNVAYQNISLGDCFNGIEIEIKIECGAITTKNFYLGDFRMNKGSILLPFMPKSFEEELRACQRYYVKSIVGAYGSYINCYNHTTTGAIGTYNFTVPMRIAPTLEVNSTANKYLLLTGGTTVSLSSVPTIGNATTLTCQISSTVASGLTVGQAGLLRDSGDGSTYLGFYAEL